MSLIMESFRKFIDEHDDKSFDSDKVQVHLFEGKSKSPTSQQPFDELLSEYKDNKIDEEILLERWHRSIDYEHNELLNEGIADTLQAPIKAFASFELFVKAKNMARAKVSKYAAKMFAGFAKIMQAIIKRLASFERKIFDTAISPGDQKQKTSIILKTYQGAIKIIGAAAKKIGSIAMSIAKGIFKAFNHPLVKAAIIIILISIVVLAVFKASLFTGALLGVPAWAVKRLGRKGFMAFYKMIPAAAVATESINEVLDPQEVAELIADVIDFDEIELSAETIGKTVEVIASDISVGATAEYQIWSLQYVATHTDSEEIAAAMADGASEAEALADTMDAGTLSFVKTADAELMTDLQAIQTLQRALETSDYMEIDRLISISAEADSLMSRTIKTAIIIADKTCTADPAMCEGAEILAQEFKTYDVHAIHSEIQTIQKVVTNDEVIEGWTGTYNYVTSDSAERVISTPYDDAAKIAARAAGTASKTMVKTAGDQITSKRW